MSQVFLKAAYDVLCLEMKPLTIKEIVEKALLENLLPTKSKNPINILQARISEHVTDFGKGSTFIRVGQGKVALSDWSTPSYKAKSLYKSKNEIVIGITRKSIDSVGTFFGFSNSFSKYLTILADTRNLRLQNRTISKKELGVKQLISYIILKNKKGDVLSYRRASSEKSESLLKGTLAIGFGGHVNEKDLDLFDMSNAGVNTCAHRELFEEIKGLRIDKLTMIGVINDDSSPLGYNKIAFIFEGILSEDFNCNTYAKEMAINQIKFLKVSELWDSFHDMEFWSQLILKCHICNKRQRIPTLVKSKRRPFLSAPLIVVGEIGAGKTEVTNFFKNKFQGTIISIRECICEVMGIIDFGNDNRVEFQRQSQELISKGSGVRQLIHNVTEKIKNAPDGPIVIDGVRNLKTYNLLKKALPKIFVIFVDAPRDVAFNFYCSRVKNRKVSIDEFREVRHHESEKEVVLFKNFADVIVYNSGSRQMLNNQLQNWIAKFNTMGLINVAVNQ